MTVRSDAYPADAVQPPIAVSEETQAEAARRYGLALPDLEEARQSVFTVYGAGAQELWRDLLRQSGLRGAETDRDSLSALLNVMRAQDPVLALCARALSIRMETYDHLTAAYHLVRNES